MRRAAFFDLDGTLLTVNSAHLWIRRERRLGRVSLWQLIRVAVMLAGYRLGFLNMERALRAALGQLVGVPESDIRAQTRQWWIDEVRPFIAPGAKAVVEQHRKDGDLLVLLTSSSKYASEMAIEEFGLDGALFQGYEVKDGLFTGHPLKPICYGVGKVEAAEAWAKINQVDLAASSFYSDSSTDVPMLARVGKPVVVHPDPRLKFVARRRGWPVIDWKQAAQAK